MYSVLMYYLILVIHIAIIISPTPKVEPSWAEISIVYVLFVCIPPTVEIQSNVANNL